MSHAFSSSIIAFLFITLVTSACGGSDPVGEESTNTPYFEPPPGTDAGPVPCDQIPVFTDRDGDGFGGGEPVFRSECGLMDQESLEGGDCDDTDAQIYPGATERCDWVDRNCDGAPGHLTYHDPERLFTRSGDPRPLGVAVGDDSFAVVWNQSEAQDILHLFQVIRPDGTRVPSEPIELTRASQAQLAYISLVWEPASRTFVILEEVDHATLARRDVFARRYDLDARLIEPRRHLFSTHERELVRYWSVRPGVLAAVWPAYDEASPGQQTLSGWHSAWSIDSGEVTEPRAITLGARALGEDSSIEWTGYAARGQRDEIELVVTWSERDRDEEFEGLTTIAMETGVVLDDVSVAHEPTLATLVEVKDQVWRMSKTDPSMATFELERLDGSRWEAMGRLDLGGEREEDMPIDVVLYDERSGALAIDRGFYDDFGGVGSSRIVVYDIERGADGAWSHRERLVLDPQETEEQVSRSIDHGNLRVGRERVWFVSREDGLSVRNTSQRNLDSDPAQLAPATEWLSWEVISAFWDEAAQRWRAVLLDSDGTLSTEAPAPEFALVSLGLHAQDDADSIETVRSTLPFIAPSYSGELVDDAILVRGSSPYASNASDSPFHEASYSLETLAWMDTRSKPSPFERCAGDCRRVAPRVFSQDVMRQVQRSNNGRWGQLIDEFFVEVHGNAQTRTLRVGRLVDAQVVQEREVELSEDVRSSIIPEAFVVGERLIVLLEDIRGTMEVYAISIADFEVEHLATLETHIGSDDWAYSNPDTVWWLGAAQDDALVVYRADAQGELDVIDIDGARPDDRPIRSSRLHGMPDGSMVVTWDQEGDGDTQPRERHWQWLEQDGTARFEAPRQLEVSPRWTVQVEWLDGHVVFVQSYSGNVILTAYDTSGVRIAQTRVRQFERLSTVTPWNNGSSLTLMTRRGGVDVIRPACVLD